jgi:cobalamin-dependent methionine synthase I
MLIIAERIDATRKHIAQAIAAKNALFIQNEAKAQAMAGADSIGIKTGAMEGEEELLRWVVEVVQDVTDLPLSVDYKDPAVTKVILPFFEKKPFLNTTSMSQHALERFLPSAAEHRTSVILGSHGGDPLNESWEQRLRSLDHLVQKATDMGFPLDDLYIDILVSSLSINRRSAMQTFETIQRVVTEFPGIHTICDLKIISQGLPRRRLLDSTFLVTAIVQGLDSAILDPTDKQLYASVKAALLIAGRDEGWEEYIKAVREHEYD